jgi:hypothetical protein
LDWYRELARWLEPFLALLGHKGEKLSFGHHEAAAAQSRKEQRRLLDLCEKHGWTIDKLREQIREKTRWKGPTPREPTGNVHYITADWLPKPRILHPWPSTRFAVTHPR